MAAGHDRRQGLHEYNCVETTSAETATDEKCSALAQKAPDHRQVEIDTRGYVRDGIPVHVNDIREQQVIHVAAMTGNVDDFIALGRLLEGLDMAKLHAVV